MSEQLQVSLAEAGRMLGGDEPFSVRTIQRLIACGELIATGAGRLRRVDYQSILDKQARMRQGEPLWPARRKNAVSGGKVIQSTPLVNAGSAQSRSETNPENSNGKVILIARPPSRGV